MPPTRGEMGEGPSRTRGHARGGPAARAALIRQDLRPAAEAIARSRACLHRFFPLLGHAAAR